MDMERLTAARIHNYGGPEVVQMEKATLPEPKPGEVVVRAHAAGVNPVDWKIRAGYMQGIMHMDLPFTLGVDFSGVVEAVGKDVDFEVGDEVYGQAAAFEGGSGSFAEALVASAETVAAKPRTVSHTEAAALPLAGVSALQAITEHLLLKEGQNILIHGGAGGIGSIAIQLAKHIGAHVATTVKFDDCAYVKSLGAYLAIDYRNQKFDVLLKDLDAVLDTVGGETYLRSFPLMKKGGRIVSMIEPPRQDLMREFGVQAIYQFTQVTRDRLQQLAELVDKGAVKVHIEKTFPLKEAAEALRALETDHPRGKVVLKIT